MTNFIVTLKEGVDPQQFKSVLNKMGASINHEYSLVKGFAVSLPSHLDISALKKHNDVATVEQDSEVKAN